MGVSMVCKADIGPSLLSTIAKRENLVISIALFGTMS